MTMFSSRGGTRRSLWQARNRLVEDRAHRLELRAATKKPSTTQRLPQHDTEGEDVGTPVRAVTRGLLGRHVFDLALEASRDCLGDPPERAGDAEIDDFDRSVERHEDVLRRDVAVDDVEGVPRGVGQGVGITQTVRRLPDDERRLPVPEWPLGPHRPAQDGGERLALHRLHHEEVAVAVPADLDNPHDVRVVEQRPDPRLIKKHPDELLLRGQMGQDPFDDHEGAKGRQLA